MPLIRVREKNQVTLPRDVMESLQMHTPGHLQYTILQDGVLIRPVSAPQDNKLAKIRRLSQSVRGVYGSSAKVDEFISKQRDAWK